MTALSKNAFIFLLCFLPLLSRASLLDTYGNLTAQTLLIAPGLPNISDSAISDLPADTTNAIARIEEELAKHGIAIVQDGAHFIRLLPREDQERLMADAPLRGGDLEPSAGILPLGNVSLQNADLTQVLALYAALSQRNVLRPLALASGPIALKTTCPLNRNEVVYALNTLLAFNGIAMVNDGDLFVQAVPTVRRAQVKPSAPKRDPNEKLLDAKRIPTVGVSNPVPVSQMEREFQRLQRAFYAFMNSKGPPSRPAFRLLEFYADLTDKTALKSTQFDGSGIYFHVQTPLTKNEVLYAVETTLRLNRLAIVSADGKQIRLGRFAE